ncbi:alpha-L-glutamate ligase-like protein [Desulfobotulus sp.]|jgi:alpha-L-glutamate ligase-like protein|uniref:alpha-L-glutamate ligase-like protein n=1 Tax=Desulfobotulus sp. TaxID=1940337 RepID=UPI002A36C794|nr:alpha-L-glutamate ligase-like protein [Desulfobotulus sp.]MDY0164462.1 alpha-L-glutamate ligase-like protein [Desulfobotulus sp.]
MKWISPGKLASMGILGMNRRNAQFIAPYNPRHLYPLVDNKLKTKRLAQLFDIPTPTLRFVLTAQHEIKHVRRQLQGLEGFAIKPAKGSGGKGILVISRCLENSFVKTSGKRLAEADVQRHLSNILAGLYSLGGTPDTVLVEDLIRMDPLFDGYSYQGIPDIRVIVFQGYPVMGMLRLATEASDGKANLHQGAVGVGLDLATGRGLRALQFGQPVTLHPDTRNPLDNIRIPDWEKLLILASRCHEMTGLGYIGADIVLDKNRGPLLLELNARPGLAIQMTNGEGLLLRLRKIETLAGVPRSPEERVSCAMKLFGKNMPDMLP